MTNKQFRQIKFLALLKFLKEKGVKQHEVWKRLEISKNRLSDYKTGQTNPPDTVIENICKLFHCNIDVDVSVSVFDCK